MEWKSPATEAAILNGICCPPQDSFNLSAQESLLKAQKGERWWSKTEAKGVHESFRLDTIVPCRGFTGCPEFCRTAGKVETVMATTISTYTERQTHTNINLLSLPLKPTRNCHLIQKFKHLSICLVLLHWCGSHPFPKLSRWLFFNRKAHQTLGQ